jgi:hypothetical protein
MSLGSQNLSNTVEIELVLHSLELERSNQNHNAVGGSHSELRFQELPVALKQLKIPTCLKSLDWWQSE